MLISKPSKTELKLCWSKQIFLVRFINSLSSKNRENWKIDHVLLTVLMTNKSQLNLLGLFWQTLIDNFFLCFFIWKDDFGLIRFWKEKMMICGGFWWEFMNPCFLFYHEGQETGVSHLITFNHVQWVNERVSEWTDEWINEWTDKWVNGSQIIDDFPSRE